MVGVMLRQFLLRITIFSCIPRWVRIGRRSETFFLVERKVPVNIRILMVIHGGLGVWGQYSQVVNVMMGLCTQLKLRQGERCALRREAIGAC